MASSTAARPSFAVLTDCRFSPRSVERRTSVSLSLVLRSASDVVSPSISNVSVPFLASSWPISAASVVVSASLKSRALVALPTSSSQKPFFVASCVDSLRRRSMSLWIRVFTLAKGSAAAVEASAVSTPLPRREPSASRKEEARLCADSSVLRSALWAETAAERWPPRRPRPYPSDCSETSCRREGTPAFAVWGVAAAAAVAFAAGTAAAATPRAGRERSRSSARLLTASSSFTLLAPSLPSLMMARAAVSAVISSARVFERWSQSLALASHCCVRSLR
mmetsp:Transcript_114614/g.356977  ORF Transcript_114614/g.356977 Transcript_114614/m.356977 type:complete len:279 (-) Transcript_114614:895-1731(-)